MKNLKQNIVLVGMRGSGKTAIGETLARHLDWKFIDVDRELEEGEGLKISEIVAKHDWEHFRDLESKYAAKAASETEAVISTGGGVILREQNIEALKKNGVIIFIHAPLTHLARRVAENDKRPSLTGKTPTEELEQVWKERNELYKKYADVEVTLDFETKNKKTDLIRKSKLVLKAVKDFVDK